MKRSISLILILMLIFTSGIVVTAAGGGGDGGVLYSSIMDFYDKIDDVDLADIVKTGAIHVDADIKINDNETYTATVSDSSSHTANLIYKATVDMSPVRDKFVEYITYSQTVSADDSFLNNIKIIGAFQVDIIFPKEVAEVIENNATLKAQIINPVADMGNLSIDSTNVTITDIYTEYNYKTNTKEARDWSVYNTSTGEYKLSIKIYPKSPVDVDGNPLTADILRAGDLRDGVFAGYATYNYNDYLADLTLEFPVAVPVTHTNDGVPPYVTKGTAYGNVSGITNFVHEDGGQLREFETVKYSSVQKTGYEDTLYTPVPADKNCLTKSKKITATYEISDLNTKKIIFHVNGTYLVPPAVDGTDYTGIYGPIYGMGSVDFDVSAYNTIPGKRTKYKFLGWSTTGANADIIPSDTTFTDAVTHLYAMFEEKTPPPSGGETDPIVLHYIIDGKYDAIAPTTGYAPIKVTLSKLDIPEMPGFKFDGWYEDGTYRNKVSNKYTTSVSTSLFARFVKIEAPDVLESDDHFAYIIGYPEGDVRPLNNITREEIAVIFYRLLKDEVREQLGDTVNEFTDVLPDRWSNKAISTMENGGYITGYEDGSFRPGNFITRAEFATIAARFLDKDYATELIFSDISGHWAEKYIESVTTSHWVNGYEDGTFRPDRYITRAEAITIINRILVRYVNREGIHADARQWPDNPEDAWYYYDMIEATSSHYYYRMDDGIHEKWTDLKPNKVWDN